MSEEEFLAALTGSDSDLRLASKPAKDEADLIRICESHASVIDLIPRGLIPKVDAMREEIA